MPDFVTLTCPSCGSKLQITEDVDRFACSACGNEHVVNRSGGIVTLKPIIDSIKSVQAGVDKTASELAITRLEKEISRVESEINAAQKYEHSESCLGLFLGLGLYITGLVALLGTGFGIFFVIIGAWNDSYVINGLPIPIWSIIPFAINLLAFFVVNSMSDSNDRARHKEKLDRVVLPLERELGELQTQLAKHKDNVGKY